MRSSNSAVLTAIIAAVFWVQACNESPTAVVDATSGIDLAAKPNCDVDPSHPSCGGDDGGGEENQYEFSFSGEVGGTVTATGSESMGQMVGPINDFDTTFLNTAFGGQCFVAAPTLEMGSMSLSLNSQGLIDAQSTFFAFGTNGSEVRYIITMTGPITSGDWLPTATTEIRLDTWSVKHDSGKGKKVACEGSGVFTDATVTATLVP